MIHVLLFFHRYLGIAVGALMAMWCASGVVMMYVSYPDLQEESRQHHLAPIVWSSCCKISDEVLADNDPVSEFQVEMLAGRPVLQLRSGQNYRLIDLVAGSAIHRVSIQQATEVAKSFAEEALPAAPRLLGLIDDDQWTVSGSFNADRPLYHFSMGDGMRTELYVSSATGHAVQITTAPERFWNWVGSVPHWLYFAELRRRPSLWSQIVILTSLMGCFLTATGIYVGVRQFVRRPAGRWSRYRGINLWHHAAGLFVGVFALTWILSGLLSMNPWGWLEGAGSQPERAQLRGKPDPSGAQIKAALAAVVRAHPIDVVSLDIAPLDGRLYLARRKHSPCRTAASQRRRRAHAAEPHRCGSCGRRPRRRRTAACCFADDAGR
jgi:hypothetical protein